MGWKDKFTFRDKRGVKHEVGGHELVFYPNRMALLTQARDLSTPVAQAISVLFSDESKDRGSQVKRHHEGEFYMEDVHNEAITADMARYRQDERDKAIEKILGTLCDPRSMILLGALFMDSLREEFPYKRNRGGQEIEEFLFGEEDTDGYTGLDMPVLMELFKGWMRGNAKVFGSSGEKMVGLVRKRMEDIQSSNSETTDSTNGNDSKTPSSPQLVTDSEPNTSTS